MWWKPTQLPIPGPKLRRIPLLNWLLVWWQRTAAHTLCKSLFWQAHKALALVRWILILLLATQTLSNFHHVCLCVARPKNAPRRRLILFGSHIYARAEDFYVNYGRTRKQVLCIVLVARRGWGKYLGSN